MAKVFVANTTQQVQEFSYRMLESPKVIMQRIPIGQQVQLPGDGWQPEDIEYLEKQHRRYGMVPVSEIDRTKAFIGVCYSIDKPVQIEAIRRALVANLEVLEERGKRNREAAAVATAQQITEATPTLRRLEMSIEEEGQAGQMAEGVRVVRDGEAPGAGEGRQPRKRGRRA